MARRLGLLPQTSTAPDGITVADLVARGRHPHQRLLRQWSREDERAVREAMAQTRVDDLAERLVDELSGGQRQRVWLAMALAQETPLLLLDEPTTFLDIAHQMEVLDLCAELHEQGRTLVAVLHDLNHACRYATHLIAMREGAIVAEGDPARDRRRRARRVRLRAAVPGRAVPGDRGADGRAGRAAGPRAVSGGALLRAALRVHPWRVGLAAALLGAHQAFEALVPVCVGATLDAAIEPSDSGALVRWLARARRAVRAAVGRVPPRRPRRRRGDGAGRARAADAAGGRGSWIRAAAARAGGSRASC